MRQQQGFYILVNEEGFVSPGSRDAVFVNTNMRILTWNIWWRFGPYEQRRALISNVLDAAGADIICLQEVWDSGDANQAATLASDLDMHFIYEPVLPIDGINWGMAILSKWPIIEHEGLVLPSMPSDDGSRNCKVMRVRLDGPRGAADVYNTHLSWRPEESAIRQEQVTYIAQLVARTWQGPVPPIICGDFNAVLSADEVRMLTGEKMVAVDGLYFFDTWRAAGHTDAGFTWDNANPLTNPALQQNRRLDYIFVGEPASNAAGHVLSAGRIGMEPTGGLFPSDHYGVLAELRY